MRFFSIHTRPGRGPDGAGSLLLPPETRVIASGFSWAAALFTPIWLIWHRLWWGLAGYVGLMLALGLLYAWVDIADPADLLVGIAMAFLFGASAAELRRWSLARQGWRLAAMVAARNGAEAALLYARQASADAVSHAASLSDRMSDGVSVLPRRPSDAAAGPSGGPSALPRLV